MNSPFPTVPLSQATHLLADEADDSMDDTNKTPASELIKSFQENLPTTEEPVTLQEFLEWMRVRDWPEARKETLDGESISLFQAHDGYAVKTVPLRARPEMPDDAWPGLPTRLAFEETTYTIYTRVSNRPSLGE